MRRNLYYIVVLSMLLLGALVGFAQRGAAGPARIVEASQVGQAR